MGTQVQPDGQNQDSNNNQDSTTPPSNTDQSQSFDSTARNELFLAALREEKQKREEAERRMNEMQERFNQQQQNNNGENAWDRFTSNPQELIQREVTKSVQPINDFIARFERSEKIKQLKQPFYADPIYKEVLDKCGALVDQAIENMNPVTVQGVQSLLDVLYAQGLRGNIPGVKFGQQSQPTPTPAPVNNQSQPKIVPPHSAPATNPLSRGPSVEEDKPWERLTETEKLLARQNGMSYKDYWEYMQVEVLTVPNQKPVQPK